MKIASYGTDGDVTDSCYLLTTSESRVLIDCGLFQGSKEADAKNRSAVDRWPAK